MPIYANAEEGSVPSFFFILKKKALRWLPITFFSSICFLTSVPFGHAFWSSKSSQKETVQIIPKTQSDAYRIYYSIDEMTERGAALFDAKQGYVELNYKVVDMKDVPGSLFVDSPGGKVRFIDKDGFVLAADYFLNKDFDKADLYGTIWVEKIRARQIVSADAVPLRADEMESLQREKELKIKEMRQVEESWKAAVGKGALESSDSVEAEPSVLSQKAPALNPASAKPEAASMINVSVEEDSSKSFVIAANQPNLLSSETIPAEPSKARNSEKKTTKVVTGSTAVQAVILGADLNKNARSEPRGKPAEDDFLIKKASFEKGVKAGTDPAGLQIAPVPDSKEASSKNVVTEGVSEDKIKNVEDESMILDLGGVKNEDIAKELASADKKPPTQIQPSPSELPASESVEKKIE